MPPSDGIAVVPTALLDQNRAPSGHLMHLHRVGTEGQVVIPKHFRDELGLQPGAEVVLERDGEAVRILPAGAAATRGLRGRYASSGLAAALLVDRQRESR